LAFPTAPRDQVVEPTAPGLDLLHYRDETDVSWQRSTNRAGLYVLLERLSKEVFPRGTHIFSLRTQQLADGWSLTEFRQRFFYPVRGREVVGQTWIVAHESEGRCDYFRETVASISDA
jgi:hypothetical protein